jgi:hypothetical protein
MIRKRIKKRRNPSEEEELRERSKAIGLIIPNPRKKSIRRRK